MSVIGVRDKGMKMALKVYGFSAALNMEYGGILIFRGFCYQEIMIVAQNSIKLVELHGKPHKYA